MKRLATITFGLLVVGFMTGHFSPAASGQDSDGWTTLFDGSSLEGWNTIGDANWALADDGSVGADSGNGFLVSAASYRDFELQIEFWVDEPANSGIFIRCTDSENVGSRSAYEVQINDTRPDPTYRTGAIVNVASPEAVINTGGRWNNYEITADGSRLVVTLNGTRTVDVMDDAHMEGPFALQRSAGVVKFRNVRIRPL